MDDAVRDRLTGLVQEHGVELLQDPARLEAFLRDLCSGSKAEIYCLVAGIREGAVNELRGADPGRSPEAARDQVIQRLSRDLRFDEEAATWTVDTVIAALDAAAQDGPVSDDLDHVGYCATCHAMMSSSADLETCSECGAALIDVRPVAREEQDVSLAVSDGQVAETELPPQHPVAFVPWRLPSRRPRRSQPGLICTTWRPRPRPTMGTSMVTVISCAGRPWARHAKASLATPCQMRTLRPRDRSCRSREDGGGSTMHSQAQPSWCWLSQWYSW